MAKEQTIVVVSALGGITDTLLTAANKAAAADESYKEILTQIEQRHFDAVKALIPVTVQSSVLSLVKKSCNEIEDICNGVFLLQELSSQTRDRIMSYGELLSSQIIAHHCKSINLSVEWKDSRELITTNDRFGNAAVNFNKSNAQIEAFFNKNATPLFILPGFVASNEKGQTTTLGRGGSDYTAAILGAALDASAVEIWTDVSGMMTADPRLVANARIIPDIS